MNITVRNQPVEILLQTITVQKSFVDPENTFLFFCPYCATQVVQIQGVVNSIKPGLVPTEQVVVINKCNRCGLRYNFQTFSYAKFLNWTSTIVTKYENKERVFNCFTCRSPLLAFDENNIYVLPSANPVKLPFSIECKNQLCPAKYHIIDLI